MYNLLTKSAFGLAVALCAVATPVQAESVRTDARESVSWYSAPREMQIVDDRPIVREFRELPRMQQTIEISLNGATSGIGAGCADGASSGTIPRGGLHFSSNDAASRTAAQNSSSRTSNANGVTSAAIYPGVIPSAANANRAYTAYDGRVRGSLLRRN